MELGDGGYDITEPTLFFFFFKKKIIGFIPVGFPVKWLKSSGNASLANVLRTKEYVYFSTFKSPKSFF